MTIVFLLLLQLTLSYANSSIIINAAILIPQSNYRFSWDLLEPAFHLAFESVSDLFKNFRIIYMYENDECSEFLSPIKAVELHYRHDVNVYFGPVCNYPAAPVARFTTHWKVPLLTPGALVDAFDLKKDQYQSMTRLTGSYAHLGHFCQKIFHYFQWKNRNYSNLDIYVQQSADPIVKGKSEEYFICSGIFRKLKNDKFEIKSRLFGEGGNTQSIRKNLTELLLKTKDEARSMFTSYFSNSSILIFHKLSFVL